MEDTAQESLPEAIASINNQVEGDEITMKDGTDKDGGGGGGGGNSSENRKDVETLVDENDEPQNDNVSIEHDLAENDRDVVKQIDEFCHDEATLDTHENMTKEINIDSEFSDIDSIMTKNSSFKLDSVDLSSLISLEEELVVGDKEADIYVIGADDDQSATGNKVTGDGSDSGVEINGCSSYGGRDCSPALLRAFSSNSAGYASSCGGFEDSLTASTATPAASCDSSLISCYSTYEDTEDIITSSTTMMLQVDGDGTSEGGSESSSITSKDTRNTSVRNGASKKVPSSANRVNAKKRAVAAEESKTNASSPSNKSKTGSPTATPINSSRSKNTPAHQTSVVSTTTNVGSSTTERSNPHSRKEKVSSTMTSSSSAIKSSSHKLSSGGSSTKSSSSSSMSKSVCATVVGVSKVRSKDSSLSSSSEGRKESPASATSTTRGRGTRTTSVRSKVMGTTDDGRWPSSTNKPHSVTPRSRGGSIIEGQSRKFNMNSSSIANSSFMESKASALEKYATLPRRRRCKSPDIPLMIETPLRSHSVSRDPSLNRAASLRKQHRLREGSNLTKKSSTLST
ncbi:hypothetical protein L9F63_007757 [Diploptera punctata]|uniref:Uncharacterized protein n=1 Tax=Diploptera punctata TaxID=6984 RepID=A0AAD8E309_DIPPU|nr:hypothetical protein L9F63_007757 [Diploptera punctata]